MTKSQLKNNSKKIQSKNKNKNQKETVYTHANIDWQNASRLFQDIKVVTKDGKGKTSPAVKDVLRVVAAAGIIGLSIAMPGVGAVFAKLLSARQPYPNWRTKQMLDQLKRQKYIKIKYNSDSTVTVVLTRQGWERALTYQLNTMQLAQPKVWDKRWRVVTFDIPEKYKKLRDIFRIRLKQLGLYPLQKSVYVSPYKCFDEIEFLRELYGISFTIRYLLVEKIEDDGELVESFKLT